MKENGLMRVQEMGRNVLALGSILLFATSSNTSAMVLSFFVALFAVLAPILAIWDKSALEGSTISVPVLAMSSSALSVALWSCRLYQDYGNHAVDWQTYVLIIGMAAAALAMVPNVRRKVEKDQDGKEQAGDLEEYKYPNVFVQVVSIICLVCSLSGNLDFTEIWGDISVLLILIPQLISGLMMRHKKTLHKEAQNAQ